MIILLKSFIFHLNACIVNDFKNIKILFLITVRLVNEIKPGYAHLSPKIHLRMKNDEKVKNATTFSGFAVGRWDIVERKTLSVGNRNNSLSLTKKKKKKGEMVNIRKGEENSSFSFTTAPSIRRETPLPHPSLSSLLSSL